MYRFTWLKVSSVDQSTSVIISPCNKAMSRNLNRIGIAPTLVDKLSNAGVIRVSDYYESSLITLMTKCQLNRDEIEEINRLIAGKVAPAPMNGLQILLSNHETASAETAVSSSSVPSSSSSSGTGSGNVVTQSPFCVSTGSTGLDALLGGGLPRVGITEVVGLPGMGEY